MRKISRGSWVLLLTAVFGLGIVGCGDDGDDGKKADAAPNQDDDAGPGPDPENWTDLIATTWELADGEEGYYCASFTLPETIYVGGFRPINPIGTHHTVVSYGTKSEPDNPGYKCNAGTENPNWIYASGVGTGKLILPEGVGVVLEAGQQVHVNLHLFNTTDALLQGFSGVQVVKLEQSKVVHEAEMFLPGPVGFSIPGMDGTPKPFSLTGNCNIQAEQTIFALFPHMHQTGRHFKTEIKRAGGATEVVWDADYDFENQPFFNFEPKVLKVGDTLATTCTWLNTTTSPITFGQSSQQEMCFSILMRYPRIGNNANGNFCYNPF